MKKVHLKIRVWFLNRLFWLEAKKALSSEQYATHLLRAAALLRKRQQLTDQQAAQV